MISDLVRGRLILMGFIIDDYYGDVREYQKSDKDILDTTKFLKETAKTTIATLLHG